MLSRVRACYILHSVRLWDRMADFQSVRHGFESRTLYHFIPILGTIVPILGSIK
jgi:hypothetical protein